MTTPDFREQSQCSVEDCDSLVLARGWCRKHYNRWHATGSTDDSPRVLPLPVEKACSKCNRVRPITEFSARGSRAYSWCKECERGASLARHYKRADLVSQIKLERGCADCGYSDHPAALEFDHLPGHVKLFNIAVGVRSKAIEKVLAEIEKCDVVCANCHAIRTLERRGRKS